MSSQEQVESAPAEPPPDVAEPAAEASEGPPKPAEAVPAKTESEEEVEEEEEEPDDGVPRVLVTGASGYIAITLTKALLEDGRFRVRGSVRSKKRKEKIQPLLDLVPDAKYPLRLVEADLQNPESWVKAVKSCSYVFHLASPFPDPGRSQPSEEEVIRPAVDGALNVLKACAEAGTVKRVVLTSSVAAVSSSAGSSSKPAGYVFNESDWSDEAECTIYERSKTLAEKAAWDYVKTLAEDKMFELVVVNPGYVQGPFLTPASGAGTMAMCGGLLKGKVPFTLDITVSIVDVRDVVAAQIAALEKSEAAGNRYILTAGSLTFKEIAQMMADEFRPQGYTKFPSMNIPKFVAWFGKFFDETTKSLYSSIGKKFLYNNEKMLRELGVQPRPLRDTIMDTCYSLIELGVINKAPGYLGHPSTRPPPPAENSATETTTQPEVQAAGGEAPQQPEAEPEQTPSKEEPESAGSDPAPPKEEPEPESALATPKEEPESVGSDPTPPKEEPESAGSDPAPPKQELEPESVPATPKEEPESAGSDPALPKEEETAGSDAPKEEEADPALEQGPDTAESNPEPVPTGE